MTDLSPGKRLTKSKKLILDYFYKNENCISSKNLFDKLKLQLPSLGLATVYRNLNNLVKLGILRKLSFPSMPTCYELYDQDKSHFYCQQCHKVYVVKKCDINIECNQLFQGHYIEDVDLELRGICQECLYNSFD